MCKVEWRCDKVWGEVGEGGVGWGGYGHSGGGSGISVERMKSKVRDG